MMTIRKKTRVSMCSPLFRKLSNSYRSAAICTDLENRRVPGAKENDSIPVPRSATPGGVGQRLDQTAIDIDPHQLAGSEKTHRAIVRRPERKGGIIGSLQWFRDTGFEGAQPKKRRTGAAHKNDFQRVW